MTARKQGSVRSSVPDADYGAGLAPGERRLAGYASSSIPSRGRLFPEAPCPTRSPFQRDRDRILHANAFRRLTHKTQMFVYHEGDHYRTRLTHSLEVAQIARTVSRQLGLDEDLAETLALAHDLGHPPFGHAGERALNAAMHEWGGFDHNVQSFRLVTRLERRYPAFEGLNLTWETLEGLIKHNGPPVAAGHAGDAVVLHALRHFDAELSLALDRWPSAEAQIAALADDIAWHTHDIDDGLRAGLITADDVRGVKLLAPIVAAVDLQPVPDTSRWVYAVVRQLITILIADLVVESRRRLALLAPDTADDIRNNATPVIAFADRTRAELAELRTFLFARLYRHPRVMRVMGSAEQIVADLIARYRQDLGAMPEEWRRAAERLVGRSQQRVIADFVAGMTDRLAIAEHRRLFDATPELR